MTEHHYLMHIRTNACSCGSTEQWSEIHLVSFDERTRRLQPLNSAALNPSLPFGISRLPTRSIPLCHSCVLKHEPLAPDYTSEQRWRETLQRKSAAQEPTAPAPAPRKYPTIIAEVSQL